MKNLYLIGILGIILFSSCKTTEEVIVEEITEEVELKPQRNYHVIATLGKFPESDPVDIDSVWVQGNSLLINVSYTGGCALHKFEFVGSEAIMKSMPPQRVVKLIHYDGADSCESIVNQTIEINITPLSITETAGSEIILVLGKQKIKYIYQ